jgi:hypothetical protein
MNDSNVDRRPLQLHGAVASLCHALYLMHRGSMTKAATLYAAIASVSLLRDVIHSATQDSWASRNAAAFEALFVGSKSLRLWLTAIPMATAVEEIAMPLPAEIQAALR